MKRLEHRALTLAVLSLLVTAAPAGAQAEFGCSRQWRSIGVVEVCADTVTPDGARERMSGNVVLDGAVAVGGPVLLDPAAGTIASEGAASLALQHAGGDVPVVAGLLTIGTAATADPVSGLDGLAAIDVAAAVPAPLSLAGLGVAVAAGGGGPTRLYLDRREGAGLIGTATVTLPLGVGRPSLGTIPIRMYRPWFPGPHAAGGATAQFGDIDLGSGWKVSGLKLVYQQSEGAWLASGDLDTPAFRLAIEDALDRGPIDRLGVTVKHDVPLGSTGITLSALGAGVSGLAQPPLKVAGRGAGRWGSVPGRPGMAVLHLKGVAIEAGVDGRLSLTGGASVLDPFNSPVDGTLRLSSALSPFDARGSLDTAIGAMGIDVRTSAQVRMTRRRLTATGIASGRLRGLKLVEGRGAVSEVGAGGFGRVCVGLGGGCAEKATLGFVLRWRDFPALPEWIGADAGRTVTVGARPRTIVVPRQRPLLLIDAVGEGAPPIVRLRAPGGRRYSSLRRRADAVAVQDVLRHYAGLTIVSPEPGRWRVSTPGRAPVRVRVQAVHGVRRVAVRPLGPASSATRPLARRGPGVPVRWTSAGLPRGTRVAVSVSSSPKEPGTVVARGHRARGGVVVPRSALAPGANWVHLVVSHRGVVVDHRRAAKPVWMR